LQEGTLRVWTREVSDGKQHRQPPEFLGDFLTSDNVLQAETWSPTTWKEELLASPGGRNIWLKTRSLGLQLIWVFMSSVRKLGQEAHLSFHEEVWVCNSSKSSCRSTSEFSWGSLGLQLISVFMSLVRKLEPEAHLSFHEEVDDKMNSWVRTWTSTWETSTDSKKFPL
jgi:hypothetical protein